MGRLRRRLDNLEGNAVNTMTDAQQLMAVIKDLVEDLQDGIEIDANIARTGQGTFIDFVMGKIDEIPISIRIKVKP